MLGRLKNYGRQSMTPFQHWCDMTFDAQVMSYRVKAQGVVNAAREYAAGSDWQLHHTEIAISCLPPIPTMPKYPGEVPPEDREWYKGCSKPDWEWIRDEYVKQIESLCKQ